MKILIISASTGEGHNSFAKAIKDYYNIYNKDVDVKIIDLYKPYHKLTAFIVNEFSFFFLRHFPSISKKTYEKQLKNPINKDHNNSLRFGKIAKNTILKQINDYKPDLIFTVHTYSTALINYLKRNKIINIPHFSIVPDFTIHFDVENHLDSDYIFVSNKFVKDLLISHGFDENKIIVNGLPVNPKFYNLEKKRNTEKTILVTFGGNGLSYNYKVIKKLYPLLDKYKIIVLNGHNKKSYKKVNKIKHPNLINLGYSNDVPSLLNNADVIIGKIGGATTSEILQLKKSLIVPFNSYCQEAFSLKLLSDLNLIKKSNINDLIFDVEEIINHNLELENINLIHNFNSTKNICEDMLKLFKKKEG